MYGRFPAWVSTSAASRSMPARRSGVAADNVDGFKAGGFIQHPALPPGLSQAAAWVWIPLRGWKNRLQRRKAPAVCRCRFVFPAAGGRCLPGQSAAPEPPAEGFPDMPALRGADCNSSSLS